MPQKLTDFLIELAGNPGRILTYQNDLEALLAQADLSLQHKTILRSRDADDINAAIATEAGVLAERPGGNINKAPPAQQ